MYYFVLSLKTNNFTFSSYAIIHYTNFGINTPEEVPWNTQ